MHNYNNNLNEQKINGKTINPNDNKGLTKALLGHLHPKAKVFPWHFKNNINRSTFIAQIYQCTYPVKKGKKKKQHPKK